MGIKKFANSIARTIPLGRSLLVSKEHGPIVSQTWGSPSPSRLSPLQFCSDTSPSMDENNGSVHLGNGLGGLAEELQKDPKLAREFEISLWSFGQSTPTKMLCDFSPATEFSAPRLEQSTSTWMWTLCADGLEHICQRVETLGRELDCDRRFR